MLAVITDYIGRASEAQGARAVKVAIALYVLHVGTLAIKGGATGSPDPARR